LDIDQILRKCEENFLLVKLFIEETDRS